MDIEWNRGNALTRLQVVMFLQKASDFLQDFAGFGSYNVVSGFLCVFGNHPHEITQHPFNLNRVETFWIETDLQHLTVPCPSGCKQIQGSQGEGRSSVERLDQE